ncbi:TPA: hypothetical protein ACH3X2_007201 [Trebouxia sp. C0005]
MHNALLMPQHKAKLSGESEHSVAIESGHTQLYHNWWQQDPSNICLFGAHLIGDAEEPSQYASIALTDLAFCSTWGRNRVQEHTDTERALRLILPVKTDPAIVLQAVAGLNSGSIGLHMGNVEPILVLANAIGMECLEAACIVFLCGKAAQMTTEALLSLAKLGDHIGLACICEAAAEAMIQMPWEDQMHELAAVLQMPVYSSDLAKKSKLLHHAKRGAYTELQALEVLEETKASDDELITCISLQTLPPQELQVLLRILTNSDHKPGAFLAKAVQQHTLPACLQPNVTAATTTRLVDHIMRSEMPKRGKTYDLADTDVKLLVCAKEGKFGVYLGCDGGIVKHWHAFILFEVCTHAPYVRRCHKVPHHKLKTRYSGHGHYVSEIMDGHPATFQGPFTIGVCWKMPTDSKSAGTVDCSSQAS